MDVVILAAGRGDRLNGHGIAPLYGKPLLPVNGRPLIRNAVQLASIFTATPIVVVAPENALPISQVLGGLSAELIIQREATGPRDALLRGLQLVKSSTVLVLMSDNVLTAADIARVAKCSPSVGVREIPIVDAERFTYLMDNLWVEKVPPPESYAQSKVVCWVGPLHLPASDTVAVLNHSTSTAIGPPLLNAFQPELIPVDTWDVGTPDMWA